MSKIIYIDMDDTIADYNGATRHPVTNQIQEYKMWDKDFFLNLQPIPGAKGAIFELMKMGFDLWILTQPLVDSPESYTDKAKWIQLHFPQLYKKLIMTQDKSLHRGDFLIDDNDKKWREKFEKNGGRFIHFYYGGYNGLDPLKWDPETEWRNIVKMFLKIDPTEK